MPENYDLVVCSGGDGTLDEVVTGMMQCKAKDSTWDTYRPEARTILPLRLGIPEGYGKSGRGGRHREEPFPCRCRICLMGIHFVYVAAFGLFTEVSYKTSQEWKNVLGHAAYILEGAK